MSEQAGKSQEVQNVEEQLPVVANIPAKNLEETIERAEKFLTFLGRIIRVAVGMTNCSDWLDQNGVPYLEASGCAKIARGFGIGLSNSKSEKEYLKDDRGEYYIYRTTVTGEWQGNTVTELGTCSTRDKFFAQRNNQLLPLSEIDLTNVQKKSHTNALNRLTKRLLGLSFDWQEIAEASGGKITREKVTGVKYHKGSRGGNTDSDAVKERKAKLRKRILEFCGNEASAAKTWLEQQTTWQKGDKTIPGKKSVDTLTEKQLPIVEKAIEKAEKEADQATEEFREQL